MDLLFFKDLCLAFSLLLLLLFDEIRFFKFFRWHLVIGAADESQSSWNSVEVGDEEPDGEDGSDSESESAAVVVAVTVEFGTIHEGDDGEEQGEEQEDDIERRLR